MAIGDLRQTLEVQKHTSGSKEASAGFFMGGRKVGRMCRFRWWVSSVHIPVFLSLKDLTWNLSCIYYIFSLNMIHYRNQSFFNILLFLCFGFFFYWRYTFFPKCQIHRSHTLKGQNTGNTVENQQNFRKGCSFIDFWKRTQIQIH